MKIAFMISGTIKSSLAYRPLSFAKELVKKGHEVYVFAPRFDKYSSFKDEKITKIEGVKIIRPLQARTPLFVLGLIPYMVSSIFLLFKLNPDIIHIQKPTPITACGLLLKFIKNTPVILDVDDLDAEVMKIEKSPKLMIFIVGITEKISAKSATAITAASKYLTKYYSKKYKGKSIKYVSNGADFKDMPKVNSKLTNKNKIVFLGNLNRVNILEPLLYAIKNLKEKNINVTSVIIGGGKYLFYFKELAKKIGILKNIKFLGYIPQEQLGKFIKMGDIGYCYMPNEPTIKACSSMKVFQYMRLGAIPIVSNVGDLPSYVFNGKAGYVVKHSNLDLLTNVIKDALLNTNKREKMLRFALINSKKFYSWQVLGTKVEKIYKNLL